MSDEELARLEEMHQRGRRAEVKLRQELEDAGQDPKNLLTPKDLESTQHRRPMAEYIDLRDEDEANIDRVWEQIAAENTAKARRQKSVPE